MVWADEAPVQKVRPVVVNNDVPRMLGLEVRILMVDRGNLSLSNSSGVSVPCCWKLPKVQDLEQLSYL